MKDKEYEAKRNQLIPEAKKHADKKIMGLEFESKELKSQCWNKLFHQKMNELAKERL